ncbi:MAG: RecX family transcriptional regulator [Bacteroidetes bacterium]|nr:RecX family transcriptional regulator [Bacteroidota bacterium]
MKISAIEKQKKDRQRYNIFMDGEFYSGLYEDTIVKYGLRTGDELSEADMEKIRSYDEFNYAKTSAYRFLAYRQRSKKEMILRLKQKKISLPSINKVIKLLEEQKYLNDEVFAYNFIKEKIKNKPLGKRVLADKLREKGISSEISEKVLKENYSEEDEFLSAGIVLKKYLNKGKFKSEYDKKSKCYRHLLSRGFDYDIINSVLSEMK